MVVRHARDLGLTLVDIFELDDDVDRTADVLDRLADMAVTSGASVLVTDGVHPALATSLAGDVGLRHEPVLALPRRLGLEG